MRRPVAAFPQAQALSRLKFSQPETKRRQVAAFQRLTIRSLPASLALPLDPAADKVRGRARRVPRDQREDLFSPHRHPGPLPRHDRLPSQKVRGVSRVEFEPRRCHVLQHSRYLRVFHVPIKHSQPVESIADRFYSPLALHPHTAPASSSPSETTPADAALCCVPGCGSMPVASASHSRS